ncbi:prepilin-type N-terminal cleavage/methylation domain-containing protein [Deinococcus sp. 12RED42]|uniref:prepilin-type N-terminal cleavage/methylation domain-containing protein n=1 Tax=Deinococcus sp. 12RED42 TaxID=2745872 RepID=UPI001E587140|nr:prepilin-type N-terminal cleavage/methylation domain-containing protein [Deinococcus sp. 12RED42]MCD0164148.1 prepilin-type N-terminal cleavage/methylation domain-containing protein [Deinococcus sp. 12RED42]
MIKPTPPPTRGFTLIEVLVAVTIAVLVVGFVVAIVPRATSASAEQALTVRATTRVNAVTQILVEQFNNDGFQGFTTGTSSTLTAVFTTGASTTVPLQRNFATASTIYVPGLRATVGNQVLLVTSSGISKVVSVTAVPSTGMFTLDCQPGLPTTGTVTAYPARTLTLALQDGAIRRTTNGVTTSLGSSEGVSFSYLYETPSGSLIRDPAGAPANRVAAGTLVGLVPVSVDPRADRAAAVPLQVNRIRRMLGCTESAAITPNEGRLNVTISGLPTGVTPDVSLSGPDTAVNGQRPTSSRSYQPVQRGTYSMTAQQVSAGGRTYVPEVRGSPATLLNTWGQIFMATTYREARGTITANVTGLPTGSQGTITLTGPDAQTISVSNGSTAVDVAAATYSVSAPAVTIGGVTYTPTFPFSITVTNDGNVTLTVNYTAPAIATLNVTVTGLPSGATSSISVNNVSTGGGSTRMLGNGTSTFSSLAPGTYVVVGTTWGSFISNSATVTLTAGSTRGVTIAYADSSTPPEPPEPPVNTDPSTPAPPAPPPPTESPPPTSPPPTEPSPPAEPPPSGGGGGGPPQCFYDGHGDGSCGF